MSEDRDVECRDCGAQSMTKSWMGRRRYDHVDAGFLLGLLTGLRLAGAR
jgi:hypothetical protein